MSNRQNPIFHLGPEAFHLCPVELGERLFLEMKEREKAKGRHAAQSPQFSPSSFNWTCKSMQKASKRKKNATLGSKEGTCNWQKQVSAEKGRISWKLICGRTGPCWTGIQLDAGPVCRGQTKRVWGRPAIVLVKHSLGSAASTVSLPLCVCLSLIKWTSSRCQAQLILVSAHKQVSHLHFSSEFPVFSSTSLQGPADKALCICTGRARSSTGVH